MTNSVITNFRDIGGYETPYGTLATGSFYRSGELTNLTEEQVDFLQNDKKIKHIFDFRSIKEILQKPDTEISGITFENIDVLASESNDNGSLKGMLANVKNPHGEMLKTYEELVTNQSAQKGYRLFLEKLLKIEGPILFHCFAGKDRAGYAAALILKIAGVSERNILKDYLLTNSLRQQANQQIIDTYQAELSAPEVTQLKQLLRVDQAYLEQAKKVMEQQFGTFENYLFFGLKLDPIYLELFRSKFILS